MTTSRERGEPERPPEGTSAPAEPAGEPVGPARLVVLVGAGVGTKFTIDGDATVGRIADSTVHLNDRGVSRRHARIRRTAAGWAIDDLESLNGTFVNGERMQSASLRYGDRIRFGEQALLLFTRHDPDHEVHLRRQRLETLGRLSSGIAHDFNNMLGAIVATLEYLRASGDRKLAEPEIVDCLDDAQGAATRAAQLTRRLLAFARGDQRGHRLLDLTLLCEEAAQMIERIIPRSVGVQTHIASGLKVLGSHVELHQVLMNLFLNARDAMPDGGELTLAARQDVAPGDEASKMPYLVIEVQDTGQGMDPATRSRVFEPFFSTKQRGAGFGLGLTTVRDMVEGHGGRVVIDSELGRGTTVSVYLPAAREADTLAALPSTEPPAPDRDQLVVLVVDDEDIIRRAFRRILERSGHRVLEASDGDRALKAYVAATPKPDVVLLDLDMPTAGGVPAMQALRLLDPEVRVLFVSGHTDQMTYDDLRELGALGFVEKPCKATELLDAIARAKTLALPGKERSIGERRTRPAFAAIRDVDTELDD